MIQVTEELLGDLHMLSFIISKRAHQCIIPIYDKGQRDEKRLLGGAFFWLKK